MNPMSTIPPGQGVPQAPVSVPVHPLVPSVPSVTFCAAFADPDAERCARYERAARLARRHQARQRLLAQNQKKT